MTVELSKYEQEQADRIEFDHIAAWEDLAQPLFMSKRFDSLRLIYAEIRDKYGHLTQRRSDLAIPVPVTIKERLRPYGTHELARFSRAVRFYGHWYPGENLSSKTTSEVWKDAKDNVGGTWKTANIIDQILSERLGIRSSTRQGKDRFEFYVSDGELRALAANEDMSVSLALGYADQQTLESARAHRFTRPWIEPDGYKRFLEQGENFLNESMKLEADLLTIQLLQVSKTYMSKTYTKPRKEHRRACRECGQYPVFADPIWHANACSKYPHLEELAESIKKKIADSMSYVAVHSPSTAKKVLDIEKEFLTKLDAIRDPGFDELYAIDVVARTLFLIDYAESVEQGRIDGRKPRPGEDWDDVAPQKYTEDAEIMARQLIESIPVWDMKKSLRRWRIESGETEERFYNCIAKVAAGTGVSFCDFMTNAKERLSIQFDEISVRGLSEGNMIND